MSEQASVSTTTADLDRFSWPLLRWYAANARDLPWRHTRDAYLIWLSEVILQQTRVAQGLSYYDAFAKAYPTVHDLAAAPLDEVMRLWQGLGYYSRARNLHQTAQLVVTEYSGQFPTHYHDLLKLKGIGPYTAAAIAAFATNEHVAVVDGNVYRVLARFFGIDVDIASHAAKAIFAQLAQSLVPVGRSHDYNQAVMEFGALQCVPVKPACEVCPVQVGCVAYATGRVDQLPVKIKTTKVVNRFMTYVQLLGPDDTTLMRQRTHSDIWQNLYEPVLEEGVWDFPALAPAVMRDLAAAHAQLLHQEVVRHQLSHQKLHIRYMVYQVANPAIWKHLQQLLPEYEKVALSGLDVLPKPIVLHKLLAAANLLTNRD